jgi:transposase
MDKKNLLRTMLAAGWSVRKIRIATHIHTTVIARFRREWAAALQSDPKVSADANTPADTLDPPGSPPLGVQSDSHVSAEVSAAPPPDPLRAPTRSDSLLPFVEVIAKFLEIAPNASARWIWQKLVEDHEFKGSDRSIRRYLRKLRAKAPEFFLRLVTAPGQECQVDFGAGPMVLFESKPRRSWFFKMTLGYSRHSYEELVFRQDMETFIRCHENAFQEFGGVPAEAKIDNLKSGVLMAHLYEPVVNPAYQAYATHAGFLVHPCDAYQPQQKGKVERDVSFTKHNAFVGIQVLPSLEEGNRILAEWNRRWARTRIHGTTRRQVWEHFLSEEKPALKALPDAPFSMLHQGSRRVDVHGHVQIEGNFYSVPAQYLRQEVLVQWDSRVVKILVDDEPVAQHRRDQGRAKVVSNPDHFPTGMPSNASSFVKYYMDRSREIGPCCHALAQRLLTGPNEGNPIAVKRLRGIVIDLNRRFGPKILEAACKSAASIPNPSWNTLQTICFDLVEKQAGKGPEGPDSGPRTDLQQEHRLIRPPEEYGQVVRQLVEAAQ